MFFLIHFLIYFQRHAKMFLAYSNLDLAQSRQKKRLDRTEKREDYRNSHQQRRYKAGQRPDWDNGEDSEDEGQRYMKATSNAPVRRNQLNPKNRGEYWTVFETIFFLLINLLIDN